MGQYRTALQKQQHRADIVRMLGEDRKQSEIAEELGISPQLVSKELKTIQEKWHFSTTGDFVDHKARELERLNLMERNLWEAWHASVLESKKRLQQWAELGEPVEAGSSPDLVPIRMSVTTENGCGDPRFMKAILGISQQRCKLLDLYKPVKRWMVPDDTPDVTKMSVKERRKKALEMIDKWLPDDDETDCPA